MYKTDNFHKYTFQYLNSARDENGLQNIQFEYNTPGSNINRKSSIELKVMMRKEKLSIQITQKTKGLLGISA